MRKVIKIDEKLTVMVNDNIVNILDDTTFIPLTIDDMKLISENLGLCDEEEQPKKPTTRRTTAKAKPKVEPVEKPIENTEVETETETEVSEFKELPPNPFK